MPERIPAYDTTDGRKVSVNRRWVDNPGIAGGRYVSQSPRTKTSRSRRGPVEPEVAVSVTDHTDTPPIDGASPEEIS